MAPKKAPPKGKVAVPEAEPGARPKQRGGRVVPSRYMEYEKKTTEKAASETKGVEPVASLKTSSVEFQKCKTSAGGVQFQKCKTSADKSLGTAISKGNVKGSGGTKQTVLPADTEDLTEMLDSQTLLLTYASMKMEKNLACLEKEAERNLLTLSEEAEKLQREAHRKKRLLKRLKRESKLSEAVDRQLEALGPVAEQCDQFTDQYKHFATALDSTRHELPLKEIYMGEDKGQYLADLQKELAATQNTLDEALHEQSARNAKALSITKELQEASLKVDAELPRTFEHVLDLSADVSKEASLHQQKVCEDTLGLETMRQLYFS